MSSGSGTAKMTSAEVCECLKSCVGETEGVHIDIINGEQVPNISVGAVHDPRRFTVKNMIKALNTKVLVTVRFKGQVRNRMIKSSTSVLDFKRWICSEFDGGDLLRMKCYVLTFLNVAIALEESAQTLLSEVLKITDALGFPLLLPITIDVNERNDVFFMEYQPRNYRNKDIRTLVIGTLKNHDSFTFGKLNQTVPFRLFSIGANRDLSREYSTKGLVKKGLFGGVQSSIPRSIPGEVSNLRPLLFTFSRSKTLAKEIKSIFLVHQGRKMFPVSITISSKVFLLSEMFDVVNFSERTELKGGEIIRLSFTSLERKINREGELDVGFARVSIDEESLPKALQKTKSQISCIVEEDDGSRTFVGGMEKEKRNQELRILKSRERDITSELMKLDKEIYRIDEQSKKQKKKPIKRVVEKKWSPIVFSSKAENVMIVIRNSKYGVMKLAVKKSDMILNVKKLYLSELLKKLKKKKHEEEEIEGEEEVKEEHELDYVFSHSIRLLFAGKELYNGYTVYSHGIKDGEIIDSNIPETKTKTQMIKEKERLVKLSKENDMELRRIEKEAGEIICNFLEVGKRVVYQINGRDCYLVGHLREKARVSLELFTRQRYKSDEIMIFQGFMKCDIDKLELVYGCEYCVYSNRSMSQAMKVFVKTNESKIEMKVPKNLSVAQMKYFICQRLLSGSVHSPQSLILRNLDGQVMKNSRLISSYGIKDEGIVIVGMKKNASVSRAIESYVEKKESLLDGEEEEEEEVGSDDLRKSEKITTIPSSSSKEKMIETETPMRETEEQITKTLEDRTKRFKSPVFDLGVKYIDKETGQEVIEEHVTFTKPLEMVVQEPLEFFAPDSCRLVHYNEDTDQWEPLSDFQVKEGGIKVTASIPHFTTVAVQSTRRVVSFTISTQKLAPAYDYDFTNVRDPASSNHRRGEGNLVYTRPCGWMQYALKVLGEYPDNLWIKTASSVCGGTGTWPVAFHGTRHGAIAPILQNCLLRPGSGQIGSVSRRSIYLSKDPTYAELYCRRFVHNGHQYKVMFQARVRPGSWTEQTQKSPRENEREWLFEDGHDIRLYKMCIKRV